MAKKINNEKATVEVKAIEKIETPATFTAKAASEQKARDDKAAADKRNAYIDLVTTAPVENNTAATVEVNETATAPVEENEAATVEVNETAPEQTENKTAKKSGKAPKKEKLAVAKTNASGQYIIYGLYDGNGPMLYLLDQNNKKIRINSNWGYEQIRNGVAVRVDQKAIDEMRGKNKKAEKASSTK